MLTRDCSILRNKTMFYTDKQLPTRREALHICPSIWHTAKLILMLIHVFNALMYAKYDMKQEKTIIMCLSSHWLVIHQFIRQDIRVQFYKCKHIIHVCFYTLMHTDLSIYGHLHVLNYAICIYVLWISIVYHPHFYLIRKYRAALSWNQMYDERVS